MSTGLVSPVLFSSTHSSRSLAGSTHCRSWSTGSIVWTDREQRRRNYTQKAFSSLPFGPHSRVLTSRTVHLWVPLLVELGHVQLNLTSTYRFFFVLKKIILQGHQIMSSSFPLDNAELKACSEVSFQRFPRRTGETTHLIPPFKPFIICHCRTYIRHSHMSWTCTHTLVEHVCLVPKRGVLTQVLSDHLHPLHLQPLQLLRRRRRRKNSVSTPESHFNLSTPIGITGLAKICCKFPIKQSIKYRCLH